MKLNIWPVPTVDIIKCDDGSLCQVWPSNSIALNDYIKDCKHAIVRKQFVSNTN